MALYSAELLDPDDYKSCSCEQSFVDGGSDYMCRAPGMLDTSIVFTLPELGE